jgi:two-component system nitrogen regulation response regulator GlnG/two-component system response regulator HydG
VDEPFVTVNCAAIPESLIESELFGSKKGAFTGAVADRKGLFEEADTGTLFLDEIGELPPAMQVKLLRFLHQKEVRKVGDNENRIVDVRVIAATNLNLAKAVADGRFREDLYYRLNVFHLHLPPLRQRKANLPHFIRFFVKKYSSEHDKNIKGIANNAESILLNYDYPGNIRELENIIEHAVVLCESDYILISHLPEPLVKGASSSEFLSLPLSENVSSNPKTIKSLAQVEKDYIIHSLRILDNNQTEVAKRLGISRSTLWRKIKEHGISL